MRARERSTQSFGELVRFICAYHVRQLRQVWASRLPEPRDDSDELCTDFDHSADSISANFCYLLSTTSAMPLPGKATATATSILDWFKPLRSEAVARLRTNSVGLVGLAILSNLLPVPSLWRAFDVVWQRRPVTAPYYYLCAVGAWNSLVLPSIFPDRSGRRTALARRVRAECAASFICAQVSPGTAASSPVSRDASKDTSLAALASVAPAGPHTYSACLVRFQSSFSRSFKRLPHSRALSGKRRSPHTSPPLSRLLPA